MRRVLVVALVTLLAAPPREAAPAQGSIEGVVTVSGRSVSGVALNFIEIDSNAVHRVVSGPGGIFQARIPAGRYTVTSEAQGGLVVNQAPSVVEVAAGGTTSTRVDFIALPSAMPQAGVEEPPASTNGVGMPPGEPPPMVGAQILHEPVGCFIAGEFPLLDADIRPPESVARARAYFKSVRSDDYVYVEGTASEGRFVWKLPRPTLAASPITYYLWVATTELDESRLPEIEVIVVNEPSECPADRKIAAIGPPGEVTVYAATSGSLITPAGFAAGGLALTIGTVALLVTSAAATGITTVVTVFNPEPAPTETPPPTPLPSPTPTPEGPPPSPSPAPTPEATPGPTNAPTPHVGP
jgi:hypothetical protein